jgi:hypothetical protein
MEIAPEEVTPETPVGLHAALVVEETIKDPKGIVRNTISKWNRAMRSVPGCPQHRLSTPTKKEPLALPLTAFPLSFQEDVATWRERIAEFRPRMPGAAGPCLFPGPNGRPRSKTALSDGIGKALRERAGLEMNRTCSGMRSPRSRSRRTPAPTSPCRGFSATRPSIPPWAITSALRPRPPGAIWTDC